MRRVLRRLSVATDWVVAQIVAVLFALVRAMPPETASNLGGAFMRTVGPLLPAHRLATRNLRAAMPELDQAAQKRILNEAWDNLGRMACEYVHIDRIAVYDEAHPERSRLQATPDQVAKFLSIRDDGKPALIFAAHLANWELPAVVAAQHGMAAGALYRTPNNRFVAKRILKLRSKLMGRLIPAGGTAPLQIASALERGEHIGMLVDQRFGRGPVVQFFGRPAKTTPLLAKLARHVDCPVYGVRAIRMPGVRFRMEAVGPIDLPRDAEGRVDELGVTEAITRIVEGWVRETPGQWLWMHNRWRM
jgi:Kdo2-lipid IVA lauroyltransferase/acyltransferase